MLIEEFERNKHDVNDVEDLLAMAIGRPSPERLQKLLDTFYAQEGHAIFVSPGRRHVAGMIGLDYTAAPHGWITHLSVRPELRRHGIGRRLIDQVASRLKLESIGLETDQDAVDFYRACRFEATEIESQWPGIRRFRCIRGKQPDSVLQYYDNLTLP